MATLTGHVRLIFGMVIPRVLVNLYSLRLNISNNDVEELTHLKALRRVWPVNWSRPFFCHPKEKQKKRFGHVRLGYGLVSHGHTLFHVGHYHLQYKRPLSEGLLLSNLVTYIHDRGHTKGKSLYKVLP